MQNKIKLLVGGTKFETFEESLLRYPNTVLGDPIKRFKFYNADYDYFEFHTNPHIFDYVLFFYQSNGILAKPDFISDSEFQRELEFFGLLTLNKTDAVTMPENKYQRVLWEIMEYPEASIVGKVLANLSVLIVIMSTVTLCIESSNEYQHSVNTKDKWFIMESFYVGWFSAEYIARLIGAPVKREFLLSVFGVIDIMAILPYFASLLSSNEQSSTSGFSFMRTLRLVQVLRIFKISRHSKSMRLFGRALMYCKGQMGCMIFFFFINCLFAASLMHFVERSEGFQSIVDAFWFCTITMTTVGYGDVVPVTAIGKIVASFCIVAGILSLFNLFIPVYLSYFSLLYELSSLSPTVEKDTETDEDLVRTRSASHRSTSITSSVSVPARSHFEGGRAKSEEQHMNKIKMDYIRRMSVNDSPINKQRDAETASHLPIPKLKRSNSVQFDPFDGTDVPLVQQGVTNAQLSSAMKRKLPKVFRRTPTRDSSLDSITDCEFIWEGERKHLIDHNFEIPLIIIEEYRDK